MAEMGAFWVGFGVAVAVVLVIWLLVGLWKGFRDEIDERFKCLWDASLRTSETGSMLAGRLCETDARVVALEKAAQAKEATVK